ncbi:SDR family NAD(P)-dependent oxidoreductase [Ramlibacter algicola]|uniref:SDR family NAD(P)-dependent oxidoreductase n=1 Tax=Ramlibacter algicola TaxID=2795217 RepID=A0A934PXT1_9BURK|nr:SDR family NAD(P)-dependent oxidoreductase [Ramlibacter algicola]MBK0392495.1 SDR family NAD(P)-dependent oxidoreductase [Ramlibacter algicola]
MTTPLTILTGASRGMGLAMAEQLLDAGHDLLCISRKTNDALEERARSLGRKLVQWPQDLARTDAAAAKLETWIASRDAASIASATLINNAGVVPTIAPVDAISAADLVQALRVDLEAPMLLASAFLRATASWTCPRKVLNISSGLGRRAMASQAVYCAGKAGLDHFTRCLALEQAQQRNGAKVCSLAPGVIDTDMQVQMRGADPSQFPDVGTFQGLKAQGQLTSAQDAARRVLAYLARPDFGTNAIGDVRDA